MIITSLELKDFRNYKRAEIELSEGVNILYGENAQGKTNLLEAVYVGATGHSHRAAKDHEMIRFGEEEAHIKYFLNKKNTVDRIDVHLKTGKSKGIAFNGIPLRHLSELCGLVNVIIFSPSDLDIIKEGPSARRKFLDMEMCQLDKVYLNQLNNYNKVLSERNALLKNIDYHPDYMDTLQVWDDQLVKYGVEVIKRRDEFVEDLNQVIYNIHSDITEGKEKIYLTYEPKVEADDFVDQIKRDRSADISSRVTLSGPHRDDIAVRIEDMDVRKYGSQGQQRTAALSLKLSEIELVKKMTGDTPILLLDDVLSELDGGRQKKILDNLENIQTIITCTGVDEFVKERFPLNQIYRVKEGTVTKEN